MQSLQNKPIGVFDSGFGGLTVLKELQRHLPSEDFIYLGDTARLPYGTKSPDTILRYTRECSNFLAHHGVKLIVIACNTATALALDQIKSEFSIPIVGVIDPVISQLDPTFTSIGVLATRATTSSGIYPSKIHLKLPSATVTTIAAPLLVSLVEEGYIDHPMTALAIEEYTKPLLQANVQSVILACTHFPLLKKQIQQSLGSSISIIDPALSTALEVKNVLDALMNESQNTGSSLFFVTDDVDKFQRLGPQFLEKPILTVCKHSYGALTSY